MSEEQLRQARIKILLHQAITMAERAKYKSRSVVRKTRDKR